MEPPLAPLVDTAGAARVTGIASRRVRAALLIACGWLTAVPARASAQSADDVQLWMPLVFQGSFAGAGRFSAELQPRFDENVSSADRVTIRTAVGREVSKHVTWLVGHAWIRFFHDAGHEQRAWEQATISGAAFGWAAATRVRLEERWLPRVAHPSLRVRVMERVSRAVRPHSAWSVAASDEVGLTLNGTEGGPARGLDRNRAYVGLGRRLTSALSAEGGYLWEAQFLPGTAPRHHHVLQMGVTWRIPH
ncbi:MAG: DUF2490 domain-containing protein [Vicinamibacterales bacterium]